LESVVEIPGGMGENGARNENMPLLYRLSDD
jgi:hypothetical protein